MSGNIPIKDDLILTRGADYVADFKKHPDDPPIPSATTARIEITETADTDAPIITTWTAASIASDTIGFRTESENADLIEAGTRYRLLVSFPDTPTLDHCWYYGSIKRKQ